MAKDPYRYFRIEARDLLAQAGQALLALEQGRTPELLAQLLRLAHTLKGAASVVRQPAIAAQAHAMEDILVPLRDSSAPAAREQVDALLDHVDQMTRAVAALDPSAPTTPATPPTPSTPPAQGGDALPAAQTPPTPSTPQTPPPAQPAPPTHATASATPPDELPDHLPDALADLPPLAADELDTLLDSLAQTQARLAGLERAGPLLRQARQTLAGGRPDAQEMLAGQLAELERLLDRSTHQIGRELMAARDNAEQLRLLPAAQLFAPLQRAARDAARQQDKQVQVQGVGGNIKMEAAVLQAVQAALVQALRNAVAHGIERPAERLAAGKPAAGQITVRVERRDHRVLIRCEDDGAGVNLAAVRQAAQARGVPGASTMDDTDLLDLLLRGGLSTAAQVDRLAGRGVGMDLVRDTAERLGGRLALHTRPGRGATLEMELPLHMAALRALGVRAGGMQAWLPLDAVERVLHLPRPTGTHLAVDGQMLPHAQLAQALRPDTPATPGRCALVLRAGSQPRCAISVDALQGVASVVLRPPPELLPHSPLVAGVALDAQQQPVLVLAPEGLAAHARDARPRPAPRRRAPPIILVVDDSLTTRMLEQSILEAAGYRVHLAACAEDGLDAARLERYALFLVDVDMPGMNGFEFVARIRADAALRHIPAVLISSRQTPEDKRRGREVGANGYIVKSEFAQDEFLQQVARLVGQSQSQLQAPARASGQEDAHA